jgi:hypothetical protein
MARVWTSALAIAALFVSASARGAEREGVSLPDRTTVDGRPLVLNGTGVRKATFLKVKVYVAGLYLERPTTDARAILDGNQPKQMEMVFVHKVGRKDIVKAWEEGFSKNAAANLPALRSRITKLNSWMSDFHEGQKLTFTHVPGQGVRVAVDGAERGEIPGDDFARALFSVWLGPAPPNESLKKGLLGG